MDEVRCRVARMFEAHLPVDETSQLNPKFVTDEAAAIGLLIETIDEYVVGRLKSWYITEGTEHPWIIKVIRLLRKFICQFSATTIAYEAMYNEFLKVHAECWKIIHEK